MMRITRPLFRAVLTLTIALVLSVPLTMVAFSRAQTQAQAHAQVPAASKCDGHSGYGHCLYYDKKWTHKFHDYDPKTHVLIEACVDYSAHGYIAYNVSGPYANKFEFWYNFTNQRLFGATVDAIVRPYSSCSGSFVVNQIDIGEGWSGYACSFNPSLSFSAPWAVGVGFWPSCGQRNLALHTSSCGKGSSCTQFDDYYQKFGDYTAYGRLDQPAKGPCYGVFIPTRIHESRGSAGTDLPGQSVCLPIPS